MRQEHSHDPEQNRRNIVSQAVQIHPPFIRHEWEELLYKLTNSDDHDLKELGRSLETKNRKPH